MKSGKKRYRRTVVMRLQKIRMKLISRRKVIVVPVSEDDTSGEK